jgi:tight adherence protein B
VIDADALLELATALETASSVRAGLAGWADRAPTVARVSKLARLGAPISVCLRPLGDPAIEHAIESHAVHGGSLATTMRALAGTYQQREDLRLDARAAQTPSRLSMRLLGGLAACCVIVIPLWERRSLAAMTLTMTVSLVLVGAGVIWMRKLQPAPPTDPPAAATADLIAALWDAGLGTTRAIELSLPRDFVRPRRLAALGMPWAGAIARIGGREWSDVARVLHDATRHGTASSSRLRSVASSIRERERREAEIRVKRAPVLLVLPLTLCFLPAFVLTLAVPMLRALAG